MNPVAFVHPTFRSLPPRQDPRVQVLACTARRAALLSSPEVDRVTTQLPKRGGPAVMVAWRMGFSGEDKYVALGSTIVMPDGSIEGA